MSALVLRWVEASRYLASQNVEVDCEYGGQGEVRRMTFTQGRKVGTLECDESTPWAVERWLSKKAKRRVLWNFSEAVQSDEAWEYQEKAAPILKGNSTPSESPPGSMFIMSPSQAEDYDAVSDEVTPKLPQKGAKGAYAFCVNASKLEMPKRWRDAAARAGFEINVKVEGKTQFFWGALYPGGAEGYCAPLDLQTLLTLTSEGCDTTETPRGELSVKGAIPKPKGGASGTQEPRAGKCEPESSGVQTRGEQSSSKGSKQWAVVRVYPSTAGIVKAFSSYKKAISKGADLVRIPPPVVKECGQKSDVGTARLVIGQLRRFVDGWKASGGQQHVSIPILMERLHKLGRTEGLYCRLFCMLNSTFSINWDENIVVTVDKKKEIERRLLDEDSSEEESSVEEEAEASESEDDSD